jgi:hypothetical protein
VSDYHKKKDGDFAGSASAYRPRRGIRRKGSSMSCFVNGLRIAVVAGGSVVLAGCGISQITSGIGSGVFGSDDDEPVESAWQTEISEESMLEAARSDTSGRVEVSGAASGCPRFKVWPADRHITVYEPGRTGERLAMKYRGSITKTARECQIDGRRVRIKYGVSGRVLMGPKGTDGQINLPANLYLTKADGTKIETQPMQIGVELRRENPVDYFSVVRTMNFEAAPGTSPSSYKLFIAFDRNTPGAS